MEKETIAEKLFYLQQHLNVPKNQYNEFGKYKYRSLEDIVEALKPLLKEKKCTLKMSDEIVQFDGRYYVKATVSLLDGDEEIKTSAYAREPENRKGMDESQITGAASSYARKYALNGLLAIDDTQDADALPPAKEEKKVEKPKPASKPVDTDKWLDQQFFNITSDMKLDEGFKWSIEKFRKVVEAAKPKTRGDAKKIIEKVKLMPAVIQEAIDA